MALVPLLMFCIIRHEEISQSWTFYLFLVLAFSDLLDGYLSRKFKCETPLGAQLDPWADKILVMPNIVLILIFYQLDFFFHGALIPLTIWLITAEMINIRQRVLKKRHGLSAKANGFGKVKCVFQMIVIGILLNPYGVLSIFEYATIALLFVSNILITYNIVISRRLLKQAKT